VNVAAATKLPGVNEGGFGYSRVVGPLGRVTDPVPNVVEVIDGIVSPHDGPASLAELSRWRHPTIVSIVGRPEESLLAVRLPPLRQTPDRSPSGGRLDTLVEVHRFLGNTLSAPIRAVVIEPPPSSATAYGIPSGLLVPEGLVGVEAEARRLLDMLSGDGPVWVRGKGGIGKTALVADVLDRHLKFCRTLWIDMEQVGGGAQALVDSLLHRLGKTKAFGYTIEDQWRVLHEELRASATIVVLDSEEKAGAAELPPELLGWAKWPGRLIVTSRNAPEEELRASTLDLRGLEESPFRALLERVSGFTLEEPSVAALHRAVSGSPLAGVWLGLRIRDMPEDRPVLEQAEGRELETIFAWAAEDLPDLDCRVLDVLCELPGPVEIEDLAEMLRAEEGLVRRAAERLKRQSFVMSPPVDDVALHTRHPFVRQFWPVGRVNEMAERWSDVVKWAVDVAHNFGGDRRWKNHSRLWRKWPSLRHVLRQLATGRRRDDVTYLTIWRRLDYFLWSFGLYRDRLDFGHIAAEAAARTSNLGMRAHALYDSIAETIWHQTRDMREEPRLDEAARLYDEIGGREGAEGRARVEVYRSRMLRHAKRPANAVLDAAQEAVHRAHLLEDPSILGHALNALGNAFLYSGQVDEAERAFKEALPFLKQSDDLEMVAVIQRNLGGRCLIERLRYAEALAPLEGAMQQYGELSLFAETPEAGMYHAQALAGVGECVEARRELEVIEKTLVRLGSTLRHGQLAETKLEVDRLCPSANPGRERGGRGR
jgi:tetratricopeptide (TPR) repeat protein